MDVEELKETQKKIKFCMTRRLPVSVPAQNLNGFIPVELRLRYIDREDAFRYSVVLNDPHMINSVVVVGIDDVKLPI